MSTITQILFRRGNDASRQTTLLQAGEPGLTTDSNRLFVGDGVTAGGNIAGNINFGAFTYVYGGPNEYILNGEGTGIDAAAYAYLSAAQIGDLIYETSTNIVYSLSATPNGAPTPDQLYPFAKNITLSSSEFFFGPNSELTLATQGISGFHINPAATDQQTIVINNNNVLAAAQGSVNKGIANVNLQYAPANSVKGNFNNSAGLSGVTDQVFLTGNNVYQFLGTASNLGLGVIGLSAGQNISFATLTATESNGQVINAVVIDSTPNIEAGDGISYGYNPNSTHYDISTNNTVQWIRSGDLYLSPTASAIFINPGDGTLVPAVNMPYLQSGGSIANIPTFSFETVAPIANVPKVTVFWTTTGNGGYNVSVFASNSAAAPINLAAGGYNATPVRGPLFPSYWQDYSWTTSSTTGYWVGGDSGHKDGNRQWVSVTTYTTNTILANWDASINCMCLSGTKLWIGGNFMNLGPTTTQGQGTVRYGIALIDLVNGVTPLSGNNYIGQIGTVATLNAPQNTPGLNILNSSPNYGLTQLSPGYTVNQIAPYGSLLCVGGCWKYLSPSQPSTSFAIFDTTNSYNLSAYSFLTYNPSNPSSPYVPATITSLVSAGSFLYIAGNFTKCKLASDNDYITGCAGLTRIKLNPCNTGTAVDSQAIGTIDIPFTQLIANQLYNANFTEATVWNNPITCLDMIPNTAAGGSVLYAGGSHYVQYGNPALGRFRYQNLTTHWIGNTALGGQDGTLTNFNCIVNGPVNTVAHNQFDSTYHNVYIGGDFTSFTSQRQVNQTQLIPCNYIFALDTDGYQSQGSGVGYNPGGLTTNSLSQSANNGNAGDYSSGNNYTSPDAPLPIASWAPVFNGSVTGIDFHDPATNNGNLSAIYCTGLFTAVGTTKAPYAAAINLPARGGYGAFTGLYPAPWTPSPNTPFTQIGGKGTNILRIPTTSPLSGVLLAGNTSFNTVAGNTRPGWARVTGLNETLSTNISSVTFCIASNVLGIGNYINIDTTSVVSLSDPVISAYTINAAEFGPKSFPPLVEIHRGDLCRFIVYRPGGVNPTTAGRFNYNTGGYGSGIPADNFTTNISILGVKLDWDTGTAIGEYPYGGYGSTVFAPTSATLNQS